MEANWGRNLETKDENLKTIIGKNQYLGHTASSQYTSK